MNNNSFPSESDYLRILEQFPLYSERGWHKNYLNDPQLGYFGDSSSDENGLRTMGNYIFTTSLLSSSGEYDHSISGVDSLTLLERAKCCLNYMTRSHVTGDITCGNGHQWGNHWQSAWWTTKMALGANLIWNKLTQQQQKAVERVVIFEASRHLDRIVPSGLAEDTKAEENAWDSEILATAIALFPKNSCYDLWREKLIEFSFNTLSVPQDRLSEEVIDGKMVKDNVYTVNVHSDFTLENHGASHFCYVASPLVSISWSYYALLNQGQPVPDSLFHHVQDIWDTTKSTFLDDRFAYIGGKDWARYTYGLYFIVPALVMLQSKYDDTDARKIEVERVKILATEQQENNDGSFFGKRVTHNQMYGQNAKYETDCYADLGLSYLLHKKLKTQKLIPSREEFTKNISRRHLGQESGICYVRTPKLFASFSWRTLTTPYPIALFIPQGMDDSAEWLVNNLLGKVDIFGVKQAVSIRAMKATGEGFTVTGIISYRTATGEAFVHQINYQVIPEQNCAIIENKYIAKHKILVKHCEGLRLAIVNDFFNGYQRQFQWDGGKTLIQFKPSDGSTHSPLTKKSLIGRIKRKGLEMLDLDAKNKTLGSHWVNIDDKLGIIQLHSPDKPFNLRQAKHRNTTNGCLHYDILNNPQTNVLFWKQPNEVILHTKFLLLAGTATQTESEHIKQHQINLNS